MFKTQNIHSELKMEPLRYRIPNTTRSMSNLGIFFIRIRFPSTKCVSNIDSQDIRLKEGQDVHFGIPAL